MFRPLLRPLALAFLVGTLAGLAPVAPATADDGAGHAEGAALGVSVPADPIRSVPGTVVDLPLRVTNPSGRTVAVRIEQRALHAGDGGALEILDRPDPRWSDGLALPAGSLEVPAAGHLDLVLSLRVPELGPDIHLLGVLVSPVVAGEGVRVVSAVGASYAIDVPGPRDRRLRAALRAPRFVWAASGEAELVVRNTGRSSVRFWGEHGSARIERTLLPAERRRSVPMDVRARFGIGVKALEVRVFYNVSDAEVVELALTRRVVVVHPAYPAGLLAAAGGTLLALARRRRVQPDVRAVRPRFVI